MAKSGIAALSTFLGIPVFLLAALGCSANLVLLDPALPRMDPGEARAYESFRLGPARTETLEYPRTGASGFLETLARRQPDTVLLSPLLSSEYPAIRTAFPDAWILGLGLPAEARTISAAWDPGPAAREAGRQAGNFLLSADGAAPENPEAVIVSAREVSGAEAADAAFLEGLLSRAPGANRRSVLFPVSSGPEETEALVRSLSVSGRRVVFLNSGSAGIRAAKALAQLRAEANASSSPSRILIIIRLANRAAPANPAADLVISGEPGSLLRALRAARKAMRSDPLAVPEVLYVPSKTKNR